MLIYNAKKEFIGIDEKDLKALGFTTLASLKKEVSDFADLFVKTPGYIHNFKHVHWIDFIAYADSGADSQAIINVNNKNFKCKIVIENLYLSESASSKSFIVYLNDLRELNKRESENISGDIVARPTPAVASAHIAHDVVDEFDTPQEDEAEVSKVQLDPYESPLEVDFEEEDSYFEEKAPAQTSQAQENPQKEIPQAEDIDDMLDIGDLSLDEEDFGEEAESSQTKESASENFDNGYVYDPNVASEELGLPIDLIEEFMQDFIAQAKEFKDDIYSALDARDFDKVKILSHKLKGVAANLRIEDAFESLSVVNSSDSSSVIAQNLDTFYKIIAKLAGEEVPSLKEAPQTSQESDSDIIDFKDDEEQEKAEPKVEVETQEEDDDLYGDLLDVDDLPDVADSDVPQKIDIAELADDEFVSEDIDFKGIDSELEALEDIDFLELDEKTEDDLAVDLVEDKAPVEEEESLPEIDYSKKNVADEIGLDIESFNELFEDYLSESASIISQMRNAVEEGDYKNCRHEALKLQGMSDNMRLNSFKQELDTLMNSNEKETLLSSIKKIEAIITKISRTGA